MVAYYFDTCIWLDYYEKRGSNGDYASKLIIKIIENNSMVFYSDATIREFKNVGYSNDEINMIVQILKPNNLRRIHITRNEIIEMNRVAVTKSLPKRDILHAILARDNYAILVSRDRHFDFVKEISSAIKPEDC